MAVKGKRNSNKLMWSNTKLDDKIPNSGWSETASDEVGKLFVLYYDNDKSGVYLYDTIDDVTYQVPLGAKAKGYTLAFKLFSRS